MAITFVLGGARSGKSRYAEALVGSATDKVYVATSQIFDDEMAERVAKHRADRASAGWTTIEEPKRLAEVLAAEDDANRFILVDCLTLWLTNLMLDEDDTDAAVADLCHQLAEMKANVALVSNEVGLGIVPENKLARRFRDVQGFANQRVAECADKVVFMAAGLPLTMKG